MQPFLLLAISLPLANEQHEDSRFGTPIISGCKVEQIALSIYIQVITEHEPTLAANLKISLSLSELTQLSMT